MDALKQMTKVEEVHTWTSCHENSPQPKARLLEKVEPQIEQEVSSKIFISIYVPLLILLDFTALRKEPLRNKLIVKLHKVLMTTYNYDEHC